MHSSLLLKLILSREIYSCPNICIVNKQATQIPRREVGKRVHDSRIKTDSPDEMWGMDATSTVTLEEGTATIFIAVDHCTQECVGIHASKSAKAEQALEPLRQAMRHSFRWLRGKCWIRIVNSSWSWPYGSSRCSDFRPSSPLSTSVRPFKMSWDS